MPAATKAEPRLVMFRGVWCVYHNRTRTSTGATDRAVADRFLTRWKEAKAAPALAAITVQAILARYLADRREARKPGAERLEWAHKALVKHAGNTAADGVDADRCNAYTVARRTDGVGDRTIRTELEALRAALNWAKAKKLIAEPPAAIPMPAKGDARQRWLTRDEAARLVDACNRKHVRLFVLIALNTGARSAAILSLTWDRVDLEARRLDLRLPGKAAGRKRAVVVPINPTLHAALMEAKKVATCAAVIEFAGGPVASVKHGFRDAAARAGLADVTPHTCRHTAATWMAQAGVPLWQVAGMLGHRNPAMIAETYGHHHPDHLGDAASSLG